MRMGWTIYRSSERLSIVQQSDRRSCRRDVPSRASPDSLPKQGNAHSLSALKLKLSGGRPSSSGVTSGGSPGVADAGLVCVSDVFVQTARTWVRDPCSIDRSWLNTGLLMPAARKLRGMPLRRNGGGGGGEVELFDGASWAMRDPAQSKRVDGTKISLSVSKRSSADSGEPMGCRMR